MLNRTVVVNSVEPSILSMRAPMGLELSVGVTFRKQDLSPIDVDTLCPQFAIIPRSRGGIYAYDMVRADGVVGVANVQIPGTALTDNSGYTIELYQRRPAINLADPPVPNGLLAKGQLLLEGTSYIQYGPLGMINVPVVTGPAGPTGSQGPVGPASTVPGPQGTRGSIWTTGAGEPTATDALPGDMYLDTASGDVWRFDGVVWTKGTF